MPSSPNVIILDMRGEVCPSPLVKAMEAMRTADKGQQIEMLTDFLPAILVITNAALKEGWDISIQNMSKGSGEWKILLARIGEAALSN
jgi:TusA-related sulfurtransferase